MANPWAGECEIVLNGERRVGRLTLGALAELEVALGAGSLFDLIERFEKRTFSARDILMVLVAGLRGGGWAGSAEELAQAEVAGGAVGAARVAAELLARAFALPEGA